MQRREQRSPPQADKAGRLFLNPPIRPRPAFSLFVGLPLPPNMPTSLRLDKKLKDFLWRRAGEDHRNLSQMIVHILELYRASFKKVEKKEGEQ